MRLGAAKKARESAKSPDEFEARPASSLFFAERSGNQFRVTCISFIGRDTASTFVRWKRLLLNTSSERTARSGEWSFAAWTRILNHDGRIADANTVSKAGSMKSQ